MVGGASWSRHPPCSTIAPYVHEQLGDGTYGHLVGSGATRSTRARQDSSEGEGVNILGGWSSP